MEYCHSLDKIFTWLTLGAVTGINAPSSEYQEQVFGAVNCLLSRLQEIETQRNMASDCSSHISREATDKAPKRWSTVESRDKYGEDQGMMPSGKSEANAMLTLPQCSAEHLVQSIPQNKEASAGLKMSAANSSTSECRASDQDQILPSQSTVQALNNRDKKSGTRTHEQDMMKATAPQYTHVQVSSLDPSSTSVKEEGHHAGTKSWTQSSAPYISSSGGQNMLGLPVTEYPHYAKTTSMEYSDSTSNTPSASRMESSVLPLPPCIVQPPGLGALSQQQFAKGSTRAVETRTRDQQEPAVSMHASGGVSSQCSSNGVPSQDGVETGVEIAKLTSTPPGFTVTSAEESNQGPKVDTPKNNVVSALPLPIPMVKSVPKPALAPGGLQAPLPVPVSAPVPISVPVKVPVPVPIPVPMTTSVPVSASLPVPVTTPITLPVPALSPTSTRGTIFPSHVDKRMSETSSGAASPLRRRLPTPPVPSAAPQDSVQTSVRNEASGTNVSQTPSPAGPPTRPTRDVRSQQGPPVNPPGLNSSKTLTMPYPPGLPPPPLANVMTTQSPGATFHAAGSAAKVLLPAIQSCNHYCRAQFYSC